MDGGIRHRQAAPVAEPKTNGKPAAAKAAATADVDTQEGHGNSMQVLRASGLVLYFLASCLSMHFQQILGVPLYWYRRDWYYDWQALVKQMFSLLLVTMQDWWCPARVRLTGDKSVAGQIKQAADGKVHLEFAQRIVLISNHQIYTDWIFLWWTAFTNKMHGHIYIILKESLKYIPLLGPGMMIFSFIFLSRHWEADQPRLRHRLRKLTSAHGGPMSGTGHLNPMWLLIFPEGTTLSKNGRESSRKWAEKTNIPDLKHTLLPRSRGLQYCLQELEGTMQWVYDCTIAYEGVPEGQYGQDYYTLRRTYLEGNGPAYCNMHWRRFAVSSIPIHDAAAFETWLHDRWLEKDALLEFYKQHDRFPCDEGVIQWNDEAAAAKAKGAEVAVEGQATPVCGYVGPNSPFEFLQIFASLLAVPIVWRTLGLLWAVLRVVLLLASLGQVRI